jgi:hypothetical protein
MTATIMKSNQFDGPTNEVERLMPLQVELSESSRTRNFPNDFGSASKTLDETRNITNSSH